MSTDVPCGFSFDRDILPLLPRVTRPARYTGGEFNSVVNDDPEIRFGLCFPDAYEIGMSNLGLRILYGALADLEGVSGERVFCPWVDFADLLRQGGLPLYLLESKRPVRECAVLGFTLQYELTYSNILEVLDLSGIPLMAAERGEGDPIIIGGGPCVYNPAPLEPYFDLFYLGDGDLAVREIATSVLESKRAGLSRAQTVQQLANYAWIYQPGGEAARRRVEPDLDALPFPARQLVPNIQAVQDRGMVEVSRGCTNGCRFCQAGTTYRPVRERGVPAIDRIVGGLVRECGYTEITLASLSVSDYSDLVSLMDTLDSRYGGLGVSFSLPSLRVDGFSLKTAALASRLRKGGLTFAVEAGDEALRKRLNKAVDSAHLMDVLREVVRNGWRQIKLYFMIGFPNAEDEEEGIAVFLEGILKEFPKLKINCNVGILIPKAHTPFQWAAQLSIESGWEKIRFLQERFRKSRVKIMYHDPAMSYLEGVFARGGEASARVLLEAWRRGRRFDGWTEMHEMAVWESVVDDLGYEREDFLDPFKGDLQSALPWDGIEGVAGKAFLKEEWAAYLDAVERADCRDGCPGNCGACPPGVRPLKAAKTSGAKLPLRPVPMYLSGEPGRHVYRFLFNKTGLFRFVSHLDMQLHLQRSLVRSGLPVSFTEGFNPKPRLRFAAPVMLGVESLGDVFEVELAALMPDAVVLEALGGVTPSGMDLLAVRRMERLKTGVCGLVNLLCFRSPLPVTRDSPYADTIAEDGERLSYRPDAPAMPKMKLYLEAVYGLPLEEILSAGLTRTGIYHEGGAGIVDIFSA